MYSRSTVKVVKQFAVTTRGKTKSQALILYDRAYPKDVNPPNVSSLQWSAFGVPRYCRHNKTSCHLPTERKYDWADFRTPEFILKIHGSCGRFKIESTAVRQ